MKERNDPSNPLRIALLVLTCLVLSVVSIGAADQFEIRGPTGSRSFGANVVALPNGNIVVVDPAFASPVGNSGAVFLYDGKTRRLISKITGDAVDRVGSSGITILPNSNFLISSPDWHGGLGAVTFCNGTTGCSGIISASNSLLGDQWGDKVGLRDPVVLANGNFVIATHNWHGRGAVTWGNGQTGVKGFITAANSLVGVDINDDIGSTNNGNNGINALKNGNYVVVSIRWSGNRGAATFCNGTSGCVGTVSAQNSLVGGMPGDSVGNSGIKELENGNYVVVSRSWNDGTHQLDGAVTLASGTAGRIGAISAENSLVGIGQPQITVLTNGNYVVLGTRWTTFGNGNTGVTGVATVENSLGGDHYMASVVALSNGNYVVNTPSHEYGPFPYTKGFITLGNGVTGTVGNIGLDKSLHCRGSVHPLPNGNFVARSQSHNVGVVTWVNGIIGLTGLTSEANSLVGNVNGDWIGSGGITVLANSNYVVNSPKFSYGGIHNAGAVTFGNGDTGTVGLVTPQNSLVGTSANDQVGYLEALPLSDGNYVARSPLWSNTRGAATWCDGTSGTVGPVSEANSLVGDQQYDNVGNELIALNGGDYLAVNPNWNEQRGAVAFGRRNGGLSGRISAANSLIGATPTDMVGTSGVAVLSTGDYLVSSVIWNNGLGAATFAKGNSGIRGLITPENSVVGTSPDDRIGNGTYYTSPPKPGIQIFSGGAFAFFSSLWDNGPLVDAGAMTLGGAHGMPSGSVNATNSVMGEKQGSGQLMVVDYDKVNKQYIVGDPGGNRVTFYAFEGSRRKTHFDYDGDGISDISLFRPSTGIWHILKSQSGYSPMTWGYASDRLTPADFDGDGKTDIAVFRPTDSNWYFYNSADGTFSNMIWGIEGDLAVPADYDGDGKSEAAVYRPSEGKWYVRMSGDGSVVVSHWGIKGDKPVSGDFDGDGKADLAVFRPSEGTWYLSRSADGFTAMTWGFASDKPVPADYDGDGKTDIAIFRPSTGTWHIANSGDGQFVQTVWGEPGDIPVPADYDGDGRSDIAVYRPSNAMWYIINSTLGYSFTHFGESGDVPTPASFQY